MTTEPACPDCASTMHHVSARAKTGYMLALDQCKRCGGIWFDRWELFPLHDDEVANLEGIDAELLLKPDDNNGPGRCPRCGIPLLIFNDANLPADALIERCRVCEGMWLQRGELTRLKDHDSASARPIADQDLARLVQKYSATVDWSHVRNLDNATHETVPPPPDLGDIKSALWSALPWVILQALFRLILRR